MDEKNKLLAQRLIKLNVHSFYNNQSKTLYYIPAFQYYYLAQNESFEFCSSVKSSSRYCNTSDFSQYDCIISEQKPDGPFVLIDSIDGVYYFLHEGKLNSAVNGISK